MTENQDKNFDPMIYDVMRELSTQVAGRYVSWEDEAEDDRAAKHWRAEWLRVEREAREVNARSREAIETKTNELRETLRQLPTKAPDVA